MKRAGIRYQPALDGLRAFAVTAVILYHLGYRWLGGGFLGVDAFFVLSGFLITTLLLTERAAAGRVSLSAFWARRARRLLPALFLLLVVVVLYAGTTMSALQLDDLRGDALASLFYVANWHFIATNQSYFALFTQPSPLQHLWSLAIEEQFYLLWPLIVVGVLLLARGSRRALTIVTVAGIVISQICMAVLYSDSNPSRAYYGTEARAHTLLVGCLLALILSGRLESGVTGRLRRALAATGVLAFAVCLVMFSKTTAGPRLFYGVDLAFAILVAIVIAAAVQPAGVLRSFLGLGPFRYVGRISYGLYLWHWPVIVFVTAESTGLAGRALIALRLTITVACTLASYYLVERPVLHGKLTPRVARIALPVSIAAVVVVIIAGTASSETTPAVIARINHVPGPCGAAQPNERDQATAELRKLAPLPPEPKAAGLRVLVIGDSIACSLLTGLEVTGASQGAHVDNAAILGCGVIADTVWRQSFLPRPFAKECPALARTRQQRAIARAAPNAIVWWSDWETADLEVDGKLVKFGTQQSDDVLNQRMERVFERLHKPGVPIVILTSPPLLPSPAFPIHMESGDIKHSHLNDLYRAFAARHPGDVVVLDLARHICPGPAPCPERVDGFEPRPYDGLHLSPAGAAWAAHWLWPQIVAAVPAP